jgi:hypothetical protein
MKIAVLLSAVAFAVPAYAAAPFSQSSVTLPDGSPLVLKCNPRDKETHYRLDVVGTHAGKISTDLAARPYCPARLAAVDGKNVLHVVLGFSGHDSSATILDVGDSEHDLEEQKGMQLQEGEAKSAEWKGIQFRVTRLP